jgi:hypothetical protein
MLFQELLYDDMSDNGLRIQNGHLFGGTYCFLFLSLSDYWMDGLFLHGRLYGVRCTRPCFYLRYTAVLFLVLQCSETIAMSSISLVVKSLCMWS